MAHHYTITTGTDASLQTLNDNLAATTFNRVLSGRDQTFSESLDGDEYRASVYAADSETRADVTAALEGVVADATTATIDYRHTWGEYDDTRLANPDYYHVDASNCHRTPPAATHTDGYGIDADATHHINGTEHAATASLSITEPTDYARRDRIVADADGIRVLEGDPFGNSADEGIDPNPAPETPTDAVSVAVVTVKEHIDRIPHGGIAVASLTGESTDRETVFEK